jgi:8-oxo-dGTP pyrophosphatase MutT (NUDIX family)
VTEALADTPESWPVRRSVFAFRGGVVQMRVDDVEMPDGDVAVRDVLVHPGSVGVMVLDDADRLLVLRQYRHPVQRRMWELPAGLLDCPGEPMLSAAQRELAEEAHLVAADWRVLLDAYTSPGISDEAVRIFVARDAVPAPGDPKPGRHEEFDLELRWASVDDVVRGVLRGELRNPLLVMGAPALQGVLAGPGVGSLRNAVQNG